MSRIAWPSRLSGWKRTTRRATPRSPRRPPPRRRRKAWRPLPAASSPKRARPSPAPAKRRAGAVARAEAQEARRAELARQCGEQFECPPPLLPERLGFDADKLDDAESEKTSLDRMTAERERIGPVNLVAEQELAELEDSRLAGAAERDELQEAINRLRGSIGSLNREGRVRLLEAYRAGRPAFSQPVHDLVRRRPGASRAGRERRSAGSRTGDHGAAAGQAAQRLDPAVGRRAGADRHRPDLRFVPDQPGADLRARRGRCAARRRQCRALLRPARPDDRRRPTRAI